MEAFFSKVEKIPFHNCWEWTGAFQGKYGTIKYKQKMFGAHRMSWLLHNGKIPEGMLVCHKCDNSGCVNPAHLFLGTHQDNMDDMISKGRQKFPGPKKPQKGERHSQSVLKECDVRKIRKMSANGASQREIARTFGVRQITIWSILNKRTWGWLS